MLFFVDTADLAAIRDCCEFFPVAGVTTNPTIISREKTDFLPLIREIRSIIGAERCLHVQTTASTAADIVEEGLRIREAVGEEFYLKIPITREGLKATAICKEKGVGVTMTAIFTQQQALMAAKAGADFVAPYVNRLDNIVADGVQVVREIADIFRAYDIKTKILAASFKNAEQVHKVSLTGADSVTINPELFDTLISHPLTNQAIDSFSQDWASVYGDKKALDMLK